MNSTSIIQENVQLPEDEYVKERRVFDDTKKHVKRRKLDQESRLTVIKLISSFLVVLAGITGYWIAGLW